ncbi:MAG: MFS transporter [Deltaproteobacteria bacterium]|nr:MFS transporter [Deltaproteobacteria bacterium]
MSPQSRLRLFYFLYYGSVGAYLPFFAAYLRGMGFTGEQIGNVQMVGPLVAAPAALAWAAVADRLGSPARALRIAAVWAVAAAAFLPWARTPLAVGAVMLFLALADRSVVPLVDSVSMELVAADPRLSYARIRLFGSVGYIALALALGVALSARGNRPADPLVPLAFVACVAGYALLARRLPVLPPGGERPRLADLRALLSDRRLLGLLLAAAVHWGAAAPFHVFLGVYVRDLGQPSWIAGLAMAVGVGAEILALLAFPRFEAHSTRTLYAVSFAVSAVRWLLVWRLGSAPLLVAVQLLHAFTFGLFWGASVRAMGQLVPARLRATGQALFSGLVFAGGNVVGYQLSGLGYDSYGSAAPLFGWAAVAELVALLLAVALVQPGPRPRP